MGNKVFFLPQQSEIGFSGLKDLKDFLCCYSVYFKNPVNPDQND